MFDHGYLSRIVRMTEKERVDGERREMKTYKNLS